MALNQYLDLSRLGIQAYPVHPTIQKKNNAILSLSKYL